MNRVLQELLKFRKNRDWEKFNSPQNIAKSIVLEAAEVLEIFQWKSTETELSKSDKIKLADELADVYNWTLLLAHDTGIDLEKAAQEKISKNEKKYPIEKAKGKALKYTDL